MYLEILSIIVEFDLVSLSQWGNNFVQFNVCTKGGLVEPPQTPSKPPQTPQTPSNPSNPSTPMLHSYGMGWLIEVQVIFLPPSLIDHVHQRIEVLLPSACEHAVITTVMKCTWIPLKPRLLIFKLKVSSLYLHSCVFIIIIIIATSGNFQSRGLSMAEGMTRIQPQTDPRTHLPNKKAPELLALEFYHTWVI